MLVPTFLKKWAKPGLFLFIFVLFKYKFYIKTVCCSGIRTWIVGKEGELADHLTTTTTQCRYLLFKGRQNYNIKSLVRIRLCGIGSYNKILQRNFKLDLSNSKNNYYFWNRQNLKKYFGLIDWQLAICLLLIIKSKNVFYEKFFSEAK